MIEIKQKHLNIVLVIITIMLAIITTSAIGIFIFTLLQSILIVGLLSLSGVVFLLGLFIAGAGFFLTKYFFKFINAPIEDIVSSKNWFIGTMILSSVFLMLPVTGAIAVLLVFILIYEKQDNHYPVESKPQEKTNPKTDDKPQIKKDLTVSPEKVTAGQEPAGNLPKLSKKADQENDTKVVNSESKEDEISLEEEEVIETRVTPTLKVAKPSKESEALDMLRKNMNKK